MPPSLFGPDTPPPSRWSSGGEPLIPILSVQDALSDPVALATWYEALSNTLGMEVPHDLLALWLFPTHGGVVLLGPAALGDDNLPVPQPSPYLRLSELNDIENIVRTAGYGSVVCLPIRFGRRDVGLLLAADLRPDRLGEPEQASLRWATQRLAPTLGRLARLWGMPGGSAAYHGERLAALIDALGEVNAESESPRRFAGGLSRALEVLLPHDHLELLVAAAEGGRWFRLGEHAGGRLWTDPALIIERDLLDIDALFGPAERLLVADTYADPRWPRGFLTATEPAGAELRALVGVRMSNVGGPPAYLLLGSVGPEFYRDDEVLLLKQFAGLICPRIEGFVRADTPARASPPVRGRTTGRHPLAVIAELLATTADPTDALRLAAEEARLLLPFHGLHYALRLNDGDRVVLVEPDERRPLSDLPLVPIAGTALAEVLHGEASHLCEAAPGESRLIVPLRVAGRIHGAVVLTSPRTDAFDSASITLAQRLADLLAPHFELLRRAALIPPPYAPGWKRSGR